MSGSASLSGPIDSIVFDLDGTLWDTSPACAAAWNAVVRRAGIPFREITADDVRRVTGRTHEECIRLTFKGLGEAELVRLVEETAVEDNAEIKRQGGVIYPGVAEGLPQLKLRHPLFIVSNCQAGYIELFLELSGFGWLFEDFECWGNTGEDKAHNLQALIERNDLLRPLLVGDTMGDQRAAAACGAEFAFVSYGFGRCMAPKRSYRSFDALVQSLLHSGDII